MSISFLILLIIVGGVALGYLAKIARRRHDELRRAGVTHWAEARGGTFAEKVQLHFFGPQPKFLEALGPIMAVGVVVSVVVVIVGVVVAIALAKAGS